ncbi:MAG: OmpA family protein [Deltaproteobacteria bacterium]|nr:MAG: OmpA family protein [Deltaproteobacteria bacterium]
MKCKGIPAKLLSKFDKNKGKCKIKGRELAKLMKKTLIFSITLGFLIALFGLSYTYAFGEEEVKQTTEEAGKEAKPEPEKKAEEKAPSVKEKLILEAKDEKAPAAPIYPQPIERHSIDFHYGISAIPEFIKNEMDDPQEFNLSGPTLGLAYTYHGKGGIKGIFSGRFSLDWVDYRSLPKQEDFGVEKFYSVVFTTTGIWTIFPSSPVNLYIGLGMGVGGGEFEGTEILEPDSEDEPEHVDTPYLLPFIHIPIGLNFRIENLTIFAETGIWDIPYARGGISYAFLKGEDTKIIREVETLSPPPTEGKVSGQVLDADTNKPLGEVIIEMKGTGLTNLSTDPKTGAFITPGIKEGPAELIVSKDGYRKKLLKVKIAAGETVKDVRITLNKAITVGKVIGQVTNEKGQPLAANISFSLKEVIPVQSDPQSGKYEVMLPFGNITITAVAEGYLSVSKQTTVNKDDVSVVDFQLKEIPPPPLVMKKKSKVYIEKKKIVITETIRFETGKARILPESFYLLDEVANILVANPQIKILIEGHTDSVGSDSYNLKLSQARADSVMNYLLSAGISPDRLKALGYGETNPIADNATQMGRAKNRRVEFTIVGQ